MRASSTAGIIPLWFPEMCVAAETANPGLADKLNNNEATFAGNETFTLILNQIMDMINSGYWGENYMSMNIPTPPRILLPANTP